MWCALFHTTNDVHGDALHPDFLDFTSFLAACERQYGVANERYTEYVVDHLSLSCQSVLTLRERVTSAQVPSLSDLGETLTELLEELRRIL